MTEDPAVVIPNYVYAKITIASKELKIEPGQWVETWLMNGLRAHGQAMEDAAWEGYCRECEAKKESTGPRWEWDRTRRPRATDPDI
jgi:hypothetical protein